MRLSEGEEGRAGGEAERIVVETGTAAGRMPALQEKTGENRRKQAEGGGALRRALGLMGSLGRTRASPQPPYLLRPAACRGCLLGSVTSLAAAQE